MVKRYLIDRQGWWNILELHFLSDDSEASGHRAEEELVTYSWLASRVGVLGKADVNSGGGAGRK